MAGLQATAEVLLQDAASDLVEATHTLQQQYLALDEEVQCNYFTDINRVSQPEQSLMQHVIY